MASSRFAPCLAKALASDLFVAGLACLADGSFLSFVFVIKGDVAGALVQPDDVVVHPGDSDLGAGSDLTRLTLVRTW